MFFPKNNNLKYGSSKYIRFSTQIQGITKICQNEKNVLVTINVFFVLDAPVKHMPLSHTYVFVFLEKKEESIFKILMCFCF